MEQNKWDDISNAFNPMEPVPSDKVDEWFVSRPDKPLKSLVNELSPARLPARYTLVGQPASGKSSELTKLAAELKKDILILWLYGLILLKSLILGRLIQWKLSISWALQFSKLLILNCKRGLRCSFLKT